MQFRYEWRFCDLKVLPGSKIICLRNLHDDDATLKKCSTLLTSNFDLHVNTKDKVSCRIILVSPINCPKYVIEHELAYTEL